ncbi:hypothetical protein CBER1_10987 [Cercospora berteroae]|uniref:Uncharacterized protein n=1 Tax=Cercospora berteroae TaxID=357750 RepID=A0A2S6BXF5_9PEZI|nr:hypothetical protein CBER1_10987 [Cercospora berteroae]
MDNNALLRILAEIPRHVLQHLLQWLAQGYTPNQLRDWLHLVTGFYTTERHQERFNGATDPGASDRMAASPQTGPQVPPQYFQSMPTANRNFLVQGALHCNHTNSVARAPVPHPSPRRDGHTEAFDVANPYVQRQTYTPGSQYLERPVEGYPFVTTAHAPMQADNTLSSPTLMSAPHPTGTQESRPHQESTSLPNTGYTMSSFEQR